jgi:CRISPR system Cascade subunit CasE
MYFSLITPEAGREREAIQQRLNGAYADHQWLWELFPAPAGTARDFLFRRQEVHGMPRYYVVSSRKPNAEQRAWQVQTRDYAPDIAAGTRLHFDLRANPTVRHGRDGKSTRHDVVMEAKRQMLATRSLTRWADWTDGERPSLYSVVQQSCSAWLARRSEPLGFAVDRDSLVVESYEQLDDRSGRRLQFTTVDFNGQLTVIDPLAFASALMDGIGPAKAFGCGLLLIRPVG